MNHVCEKDSYITGGYSGWVPVYLGRWISLYMDSIISLMHVKKEKSQRDDSFPVAMICTNECLVCKPFECKVYGDLETICVMFIELVVSLKPLQNLHWLGVSHKTQSDYDEGKQYKCISISGRN